MSFTTCKPELDSWNRFGRCGAVYNLGGGKENSVSILESIDKVEQLLGKTINYEYSDQNRVGDHICYYTDLSKLKYDYRNWSITKTLDDICEEFANSKIVITSVGPLDPGKGRAVQPQVSFV